MPTKLERIRRVVETELSCSAHDMEHVNRVYRTCLKIAKGEDDVNLDVLKAAALLHDIARVKEDKDDSGNIDHAQLGAEMAVDILRELRFDEDDVIQIKHCIAAHRFRTMMEPSSKEARILFDADKLDVLGAIGWQDLS